ncbi:MAG: hypothetical protein WC291_07110 [Thermodesulfovibrionales bacterium]|jgi:succinate dehydrogenase / fumarate reductase cytochrome b subunit
MRYQWRTGSAAWLSQRISGVILGFFIVMHIADRSHRLSLHVPGLISFITGTSGRLLLLALVIMHGLNGIRIILIESGLPTSLQKPAFLLALSIGTALFIAGL